MDEDKSSDIRGMRSRSTLEQFSSTNIARGILLLDIN